TRRPDTKWRLTQRNLEERVEQQAQALDQAKTFVRPGGELLYVTCSVLPEENERQVRRFCAENAEFLIRSAPDRWTGIFGADAAKPHSADGETITLTPATTDTDGFFFCSMKRNA
ncbi:MFS transporter, partial [Klebsiella pneumoniae]